MRELCRGFSLKSARGRGKVAILDDADELDDPITLHAAANCFLKTLEEPPPRSVFILVGTSVDRQLQTVVSRCQVVRFRPLPDAQVDEVFQAHGVDDPKMRVNLVRLGRGSPGQALALADPELWEFRRTLVQALSARHLDTVALANEWTRFVEEAGKESAAKRRRAALALQLLVELLGEVLSQSLGNPPRTAEPDELRTLEGLAKRLDPEDLVEVLERCLEGDAQIDRRVQLELLLEALVDALGQKLG
jgi:DNA polymerase-3 subunit delta'